MTIISTTKFGWFMVYVINFPWKKFIPLILDCELNLHAWTNYFKMFFCHTFLLNTSSPNKLNGFKIPLQNICIMTPFLTFFLMGPLNFYNFMLRAKLQSLVHNSTSPIKVLHAINNIFHYLMNLTWITWSFNLMLPSLCLHSSHWPLRYPCVYDSECIGMHDVIRDAFASIAKGTNFHVA